MFPIAGGKLKREKNIQHGNILITHTWAPWYENVQIRWSTNKRQACDLPINNGRLNIVRRWFSCIQRLTLHCCILFHFPRRMLVQSNLIHSYCRFLRTQSLYLSIRSGDFNMKSYFNQSSHAVQGLLSSLLPYTSDLYTISVNRFPFVDSTLFNNWNLLLSLSWYYEPWQIAKTFRQIKCEILWKKILNLV